MKIAGRRIVSTLAAGSFMVSVITGIVFSLPATVIFVRSLAAAGAIGLTAGLVVVVFERVWSK